MRNQSLACARNVMVLVLFAWGFSVMPAGATGNIVYVDVNATGAGDGTSWPDAYTNIQAGIDDPAFSGSSSNTVMVAGGTYYEQVLVTAIHSGEPGSTNVIAAKTGEVPIIDGNNVRAYGLFLTNAWHMTIEGFDIRRTTNAAIESAKARARCTNVTVRACRIYDNAGIGIRTGYNAYDVNWLVDHCTIYGNASSGIDVQNYAYSTLTVKNSIVVNNGRTGIGRGGTDSTVTALNNDSFGNALNYSNVTPSASISANPSFADPHARDFRLYADSLCIDAGSDGKDMGAYPDGASVPLPSVETYYVRPDGDDGNSGTANTSGGAFATIQHAADLVTPGDTVIVQEGSYTETVTIARSGSFSSNIAFVASGAVEIDGVTDGVVLDQATGVRIEGFAIRSAADDGIYIYKSFDNVVAGCNVYSNADNGVFIESSNADVIRTTRIHHNTDKGIVLASRSGAHTIDRCTVDHNAAFGIGIESSSQCCHYNVIQQCLLVHNAFGVYFPYNAGLSSGEWATSWLADNCVIYGNTDTGVWVAKYAYGSIEVRNSIVAGNTLYGLWVGTSSATLTENHCDVWGNGTDYSTVTPGAGSISADPLFVNAGSDNFRVQSDSDCIDAGTNQTWMIGAVDLAGNPRRSGERVDMGAYEQVAAPSGTVILIN